MNHSPSNNPEPVAPAAERRSTHLSWFCALSPFVLLLVYLTLGIHIRLGLGHWPTPMFEDYHAPAFDFHRGVLILLMQFTLFVAGPLWLVCLFVRPLRPHWPRTAVAQLAACVAGFLLIFGVLTFDPTTFSAWFLD